MTDSDTFHKNIQRCSLFFPQAPVLLSGVSPSTDSFPQQEAQDCVQEALLKDVHVVYAYGINDGYMYEALQAWLNESNGHQLILLEDDLAVLRAFLETEKAASILFHPQVWLYYLDPDLKILDTLSELFIAKTWKLLTPISRVEKSPKTIQQLDSKLSFLSNLKTNATVEYLQFGIGYLKNCFFNILQLPESLLGSSMYGRFPNIPAIICGAGPSLEKNLHLLETLKDRALIFAGGTAMNAVNVRGFLPHFGVGIDPNEDQFTRLITNTAFEVPYFYRNRLLHEGLKLIHGDHLYVPGSGGYGLTKWLDEKLGISAQDISEGCNVINFSLSIAAAMGCNPIIFVGVDLAYSNEESYATGILNHPIHVRRKHFKTKNTQEELIVKNDIHGNAVYTLWKWVMESCWFTNFAAQNPGLTLVNATEGGLGFGGIPNMPLQEVIDKLLPIQYDMEGLIHAELQRCRMPQSLSRQEIGDLLEGTAESLKGCLESLSLINHALKDQQSSDPCLGLPIQAKEAIAKLENESAYQHSLCAFNEAFSKVFESAELRLLIDKEVLGSAKVAEQKWNLIRQRYLFLSEAAKIYLHYLTQALTAPFSATPEKPLSKELHDSPDLNNIPNQGERCFKKDKNGSLLANYGVKNGQLDGSFIHYGEGACILAISQFVEGKKEGKATYYYPTGEVASEQFFRKGQPEGIQHYFYANGTKRAELPFKNGRLDGQVTLYDREGRPCRCLSFTDGKRNGIERIWREGNLFIEASFKNDLPVEIARQWHKNGKLEVEIAYDAEGHLLSQNRWQDDGKQMDEQEDDYFDQVTKQTGVFTESLEQMFDQLSVMAPALEASIGLENHQEDLKDIHQDLEKLKTELTNLKDINKQLVVEAGLDPLVYKEPLWKSASSRRELEVKVEENATELAKELAAIQVCFAKAVEKISDRLEKSPKSNPKS